MIKARNGSRAEPSSRTLNWNFPKRVESIPYARSARAELVSMLGNSSRADPAGRSGKLTDARELAKLIGIK